MIEDHEFQSTARWEGSLVKGEGNFRAGDLTAPFTYASRWEGAPGANPEELLGAAHAACFSMSLAARLRKDRVEPKLIETSARVTLAGAPIFEITGIKLEVKADIPGITESRFHELASAAKTDCPLSKALSAVPIELVATLNGIG